MVITIVLLVILVIFLLYLYGGAQHDKSVPALDKKYYLLISQIMSSHDRYRILLNQNNHLVIGVASEGGKTLFTIKETANNKVSIVYSIKDNPITSDFDLRFEFSQLTCLNDPGAVLLTIGKRIENHIFQEEWFKWVYLISEDENKLYKNRKNWNYFNFTY